MTPSKLFLLGFSHASAPLQTREPLHLDVSKRHNLYQEARALGGLQEFLILSTCNRVEFYGVGSFFQKTRLSSLLEQFYGLAAEALEPITYWHTEQKALEHLFSVCTGLDSQLLGETEIAGQIKEAYHEADAQNWLGPLLRRSLEKGFQASKWCRTHTSISRGPVSIGSVAAALALRIFGEPQDCEVLVLGGGAIAEQTTHALHSRGIRNITLSTRDAQKGEALAARIHTKTLDWDLLHAHVHAFDIIVACTKALTPVITPKTLATARFSRTRPLLLIDLGFPRNIEPELAQRTATYLYNLDDLSQIAQHNQKLRSEDLLTCQSHLQSRAALLASRLLV